MKMKQSAVLLPTPWFRTIFSATAAALLASPACAQTTPAPAPIPPPPPTAPPPPHPPPQSRTPAELPAILAKLQRGEVVALGLVLVRTGDAAPVGPQGAKTSTSTGKPWENHQVLAFGAEDNEGSTDLKVYDPNFPGDEA